VRHYPRPSNLAAWVVGTLLVLFGASFVDAGRLADKRAGEQAVRSALSPCSPKPVTPATRRRPTCTPPSRIIR